MDYDKLIAPAAQAMRPSGIRKFFDLAAEMPECISLGVGEPDFKTPWAVREAGIESLEHGRTRYTSNAGLKELRAEISRYLERRMGLRYDPMRQILVTVGGSEAIDMCIRTLIQPGDEVIIPEPCFVCYEPITTLSGGVPVHVACRQEDEFRLRADALKAAITPRTKLVIMPFPNNPTGAVMEREDLESVAEVLRDTNVMVLSDEIYAELNYGLRPHVSIASLPGMAERTIVVNGFSKSYAMTGWRLGYACGPEPIIKIMTKIHQSAIMSAPTTSQYAAITALRDCDGEIDRMRDEYNMRRRLVVRSFNDMGLTCFEPRGAFYAFPCIKSTGLTSQEFCTRLLEEKHVAIIPGDAFGASGEGYCRVSYAYSVEHLTEALKRIREFLQENGLSMAAISYELSFEQLREIVETAELPLETVVHGSYESMICDHDFPAMSLPEFNELDNPEVLDRHYALLDTAGEKHAIRIDQYGRNHLYFAKDLCLYPYLAKSNGLASYRIEAQDYTPELTGRVTKLYREALDALAAGKGAEEAFDHAAFEEVERLSPREWGIGTYRFRQSRNSI